MPVLLQSSETDLTFSVLDGKAGGIGQILLNRLSALNALTTSMCRDMNRQLLIWSQDHTIKAVIIASANSDVFCAGGDVCQLARNGLGQQERSWQFF